MKTELEGYIQLYSRDLTRLCVSLCGTKADAEDLFQESWYRAMKHFDRYDRSKPFDKWLYSICVNTYKNSLKLHYNSRRISFASADEENSFFASVPCSDRENKDEYAELYCAINNLPKKQKIVIVLKYFKDYTEKDIGQILNIPQGTVKSRLSSAKKAIKRSINDEK